MNFTITFKNNLIHFEVKGIINYDNIYVKRAVIKAIKHFEPKKISVLQPDQYLSYYLKRLASFLYNYSIPGLSRSTSLQFMRSYRSDDYNFLIEKTSVQIQEINFPGVDTTKMEVTTYE